MKLTLVAAVFFCICMHGFAGNGTNNEVEIYEKNSTDAVKFPVDRFLKLLQEFERYNNVSNTFDNESSNRITQNMPEEAITSLVDNSNANETASNASENNVVKFVNNSTQLEKIFNGTIVNELEHVDGLMKETMGKNGDDSTRLIGLKHNFDEILNVVMENVTETKMNNSEDDLTRFESSFLAENEKSNEKNVKIENKVLEFLNDATVNITVENNQLVLFVKDDKILFDEKILYVCFKSTIQSYVSSICPSGFCEVRIEFLTNGNIHSTYIELDKHNQTFGGNSIATLISENAMKVLNVPNPSASVTTCNPDVSQGYWTVKVINKGDKVVKLSDVQIFKDKPEEAAMAAGTIIWIVVGCAALFGLIIGGILFWCFCFYKKKQQKGKIEATIEEKQIQKTGQVKEEAEKKEVSAENVPPKEEKLIEKKKDEKLVGLDSLKIKKENEKIVKDEKLEKKEPLKQVQSGKIQDRPEEIPKNIGSKKETEEMKKLKKEPEKEEKVAKKSSDEKMAPKKESKEKPEEKKKLDEELEKKRSKGSSASKRDTKDKENVKEVKAEPGKKDEDKKVEKVCDANVETAKPMEVGEDVNKITKISPLTTKPMVEIDEDYDIMNEDKSKEGHKDRLEFVKARTAARDDIGLFTFGFETKYYPRPTVDDREYLAKLIQKMEMYKESDPNTWTLDREMISTEAIVYLAGLKIISKFCEPLLLEIHSFFCINENNFPTIFESFAAFCLEMKKAREKYFKYWKKFGVEKKKEISLEIVKKAINTPVLSRLRLFSMQFDHVLDCFTVDFSNPLIFLAPLQFLMLLAIKPQTTDGELLEIYYVIKYRASLFFKNFQISNTFSYYFPIPPLAYMNYIVKSSDLPRCIEKGKNILEAARQKIAKNSNWKKIWDDTVKAAKQANEKFDEEIQIAVYSRYDENEQKVFAPYFPSHVINRTRKEDPTQDAKDESDGGNSVKAPKS